MRKHSAVSAGKQKSRPRVLILAPEAPYPLVGGGALRTASIVEYFLRRAAVDLIVFRQPGAPHPSDSFVRKALRNLTVIDLPGHSRHPVGRYMRNAGRLARRVPPLVDRFSGFAAEVAAALRGHRYQLGLIEHFWCAPYLEQLAPHCDRIALDLHNVESAWHQRCAQASAGARAVAHNFFEKASRRLERKWLPAFSLLLATSAEDALRVRETAAGVPVAVYPNAIPLIDTPFVHEQDAIVFSGTLEYEPNRDAVSYFRRCIWPTLRDRFPSLRWRLVGRNPEAVTPLIAGDPRIECSGPVDDAVRELARAKVAVVPLRAGSGTRLKIIEAWAAARAVVSTPLGAEGLPAVHGRNIMITDDAVGFGEAVSSLLLTPSLRASLGQAGRQLYEREFTWQAAWEKLAAALESL
jgi:glycosyltransferase involved in cell wall biosynthesis